MAKSPKTFTSHSPPGARTLSGPATRRRWTRELLQTRNRAFGPNGVPTTSRQTLATRTDTTSRLPIRLGSTNKRHEPTIWSCQQRLDRNWDRLGFLATVRVPCCYCDRQPSREGPL